MLYLNPTLDISKNIIEYKKIKHAKDKAIDLTNILSKTPIRDPSMTVHIDNLYNARWLPIEIVNTIQNINLDDYDNGLDMNSFLYFNIDQGYSISFELALEDIQWDTEGSLDLDITTVEMTYHEFIFYLTKLFYYELDAQIDLDVENEEAIDIIYR